MSLKGHNANCGCKACSAVYESNRRPSKLLYQGDLVQIRDHLGKPAVARCDVCYAFKTTLMREVWRSETHHPCNTVLAVCIECCNKADGASEA